MSLLEIRELTVAFDQYERGLRRRVVTALSGMDLSADTGEVVALVGASGAGKSLLAHAVLGLLPPNAREGGEVRYDGAVVARAARRGLAGREIALLPQSVSFLDPLARVGAQVRRAAVLAGVADPAEAAVAALRRRGLGPDVPRRYPHELSGGMARRVLIAMATLGRARLVLADEPTPGLQQDGARAVLAELREIADGGSAVVLITHDLPGALDVADRVVICHEGRTVDAVTPADFRADALSHPYTHALWRALPANGFHTGEED
ncbi:ATP-binding cassette domain-containing protein [Actinokineospora guangxiensis]|uniref:Nickel import system ATP-binding protein NikD n=1 Tax=Actinokineospora guangxiensis TaxID=1490288 RepID=A0ABW0EJS8_9PSEU